MVCLGNICRSPVAKGVMRHIAEKEGLEIIVDSAGTSDYHIGEQPDKRSMANARKNGVDISSLRGRQFLKEDFDNFDRIYAMDSSNLNNILALATTDEHRKKVDLLLNEAYPGENRPLPDPYYGNETDFENVFRLAHEACTALAYKLKNELKK